MLCIVVTASKSSGISSGLTYEAEDLLPQLGSHVRVPLRNKIVDGIVVELIKTKEKEKYDIKKINEILGDKPILNEAQIKTLRWMSDYYFCSLRQALRVWLPSPPWNNLLPREIVYYSLNDSDTAVRGSKQKMVVEVLAGKRMTANQLKQESCASLATIKSLEKKGIVKSFRLKVEGSNLQPTTLNIQLPSLTSIQQKIYESIKNDKRPSLLFGVTSSGKTEIYASLIADRALKGKQSILLVPEILLTEHCIHRFRELLGPENVAVIHSRLTPAQRRDTWRKIHSGAISLVIGSRSALFSPISNLGLVIIDEEHEWTYKNEQTPRYHARETAEKLCEYSGAKLVLGTATPSLESWARANVESCKLNVVRSLELKPSTLNLQPSTYHLAKLPERYGNQPYPNVKVVDLADMNFGSLYPFSPTLLEAIDARLNKGEQSILFLNRRGIATALICLECRRRVVSPDSKLPFTIHRPAGAPAGSSEYLVDHTTGLTVDVPTVCPSCNSTRLMTIGAGTQKVEELLNRQFPNARILRADRDTLTHPEQMRLLLKKMREGTADILLGTQSVVKGLDIAGVTLAAVLLADVGLSLPHFRAGERIFQLLTQLTGRSGRSKPGEVIIQTFRPDAPEVKYAAQHATEEYLEQELKLRINASYPPATKMLRLIVRGEYPEKKARELEFELKKRIDKEIVSCSPTLFGGGKVWHVIIRGIEPKNLLSGLDLTDTVVDIDPIECC